MPRWSPLTASEVGVQQARRLILIAGHEMSVSVERNADLRVSMYVESAFAFAPREARRRP